MTGLFESDEEALARRIKNIENIGKPIKFHQWFIPFFIFILGPIIGIIAIMVWQKFSIEFFTVLGECVGCALLLCGGIWLLYRYGVIPRCSW